MALRVEDIFRDYKSRMYRLAYGIARNEKDAEDILQNAFLKITKNLHTFRHESQISTWIYRITYNEALMHMRKKYRQFRLAGYLSRQALRTEGGMFVNWTKLQDEEMIDSELKERVNATIRDLPIKYRMALLLHHVEELPVRETAAVMGLKVNSVKTRLHRAYLVLRTGVADYLKDRERGDGHPVSRCGAQLPFLYGYTSGTLDKKNAHSFQRHISDCPGCKVFLKKYTQAIRITKALACQDIPPELQEKIRSFLAKRAK